MKHRLRCMWGRQMTQFETCITAQELGIDIDHNHMLTYVIYSPKNLPLPPQTTEELKNMIANDKSRIFVFSDGKDIYDKNNKLINISQKLLRKVYALTEITKIKNYLHTHDIIIRLPNDNDPMERNIGTNSRTKMMLDNRDIHRTYHIKTNYSSTRDPLHIRLAEYIATYYMKYHCYYVVPEMHIMYLPTLCTKLSQSNDNPIYLASHDIKNGLQYNEIIEQNTDTYIFSYAEIAKITLCRILIGDYDIRSNTRHYTVKHSEEDYIYQYDFGRTLLNKDGYVSLLPETTHFSEILHGLEKHFLHWVLPQMISCTNKKKELLIAESMKECMTMVKNFNRMQFKKLYTPMIINMYTVLFNDNYDKHTITKIAKEISEDYDSWFDAAQELLYDLFSLTTENIYDSFFTNSKCFNFHTLKKFQSFIEEHELNKFACECFVPPVTKLDNARAHVQ